MAKSKICSFLVYSQGKGSEEERQNLETFLYDGTLYSSFISENARHKIEEENHLIEQAYLENNLNAIKMVQLEQQAMDTFEQEQQKIISLEQKQRKLIRDEERRAGFIHASILFYAILNLGIMIAVALIIL